MASTTEHRTGGADGLEPGAAEGTVATSVVPSPRDAKDSAVAPARADPVPLPRAPEPSVGADAPPRLKTAVDLPALNPRQVGVAGMGWGRIAVGVIAALLAVTLLTVFASHRTMTVRGSVTVHNPWGNPTLGGSCTGADAYSWLKPGASVTISDVNGKIVGTTTLAGGTPRVSGGSNYGNYADNCVFPFTLTDVPAGGDFYRVSVGNASTNGVTFTADELRTSGATVFVG
jgi:hypothetical protein